jgi:hypothetical protein
LHGGIDLGVCQRRNPRGQGQAQGKAAGLFIGLRGFGPVDVEQLSVL